MRPTRDLVVLMTTVTVLVFIIVSAIAIAIAALAGSSMEPAYRALLVVVGTLSGAVAGYVLGKGTPPDGTP